MEYPLFSIIIPVYNGLTHDLPVCLESIWNQGLADECCEVICVDDVSPDESYDWLVGQQTLHHNLKVIRHKENLRQGGARNTGVEYASGRYILFIDQDDYYHPGSLKELFGFIVSHEAAPDVIITDSAFQFRSNPHNNLQLNFGQQPVMSNIDAVRNLGWCIAPWRLCIRREFYVNAGIQFVDKVMIEDIDWGVTVMYHAQSVQYIPLLLIHYNKGEESTTDNIYRDINILWGNTWAARRVYELYRTLYSTSPIKQWVMDLADRYFNYSCRYCLGLRGHLSEKAKLLKVIPSGLQSKFPLVKLAMRTPWLYAFVSCFTPPVFSVVRKIRRTRKAVKIAGKQ